LSLSIVKKILEEIEGASSEIVNLTSKLVQFPTVSPRGNTKECVDFIKSYMDNAGIETTIYERREGKSNICARIRGVSDSNVLWLGHLDVVPEGSFSEWTHNPYGGEVVGDRVYGRGASDDKGSCASAMVAANILSGVNKNQRCNAEFWFTCDEEVGAVDGARWLAEERKFHGDACIIGDGDAVGSLPEKI